MAGYVMFHLLVSNHKPIFASDQLPARTSELTVVLPPAGNPVQAPIPARPVAQAIPFPANPVAHETPAPVCRTKMANGQIIGANHGNIRRGHILTIENGSAGNAIAKVRDAVTGHVVVSFFVAEGETASFKYLNDGNYRIQYILGNELAENCKTFIRPLAAKEFPGDQALVTTRTTTQDMIEIDRQELTFTLYSVPSGNIIPRSIDLNDFDAE